MIRRVERRKHIIRRQFNQSFCDEQGNFSWQKFIAVCSQVVVLTHMGTSWDRLIDKPETLLIVLVFLIAPHVLVHVIERKAGGNK